MDQGLVMVDAAGTVAVCNRRAVELLDLPADLMAMRPSIDAVASLRTLLDRAGSAPWTAAPWAAPEQPPGPARDLAPGDDGAGIADDRNSPRVCERTLPNGQIVEVRK